MGWIGEKVLRNHTLIEWVRAIGTWAAAIGIFTGILTFCFKKEKEASDRLLHIIALLDSKNSTTVRAGAVTTMGVYLGDYKQYQDRAYWVMASNLATEEDPLVRDNILNILKGAEAKAIEPLACMNRFLLEEAIRTQSSLLFSIDMAFQSDLDKGSISDELRKKFKDSYVELSECVTVLISEKDSRWLITNRDNKPTYIVRKERDQLNVYEKDIPRGPVYVSPSQVSTPIELAPIDELSLLRENENLRDITKALVAVLENKGFPKDEKLHLQKIILCNIESSSKINLDKANLKQASLMEAHLKDVSLKEAILTQADLQNAVLNNVDLTDATMTGANLHSVKFVDAILKGADLTGSLLFSIDPKKFQSDLDKRTIPKGLQQELEKNGIQLTDIANVLIKEKGTKYMIFDDGKRVCRISKEKENLNIYIDAILKDARLEYADLRDADLTNANLSGATLTFAYMQGATLHGADIDKAVLTDANLLGADLTNASLVGATLTRTNMVKAILQGADLFEADLTDANLVGANLTNANMMNATLQGADLSRADLTDANLASADLKGANLEGANLDGANLENADLRAAVLFSIDPNKFQSDLDKGTISEDLQQEFEYNGISLSQSIAISMEEKDLRWLINDKDDEQTYTVRKEDSLNICTEPNIVETELFGIDSKFQSDLDKGTISEDFQKEFENNGISLSENTTISIEEKDRIWLINDKDIEQTYTVRKEDGQLNIYEKTKLDPTELFSIDSKKFQSDLDKGTISEDLRQEFKNNWLDLSENTTISVKEKGRIWLINDKDNEQTYAVRKEERLNIYKPKLDIKKAKNWQNAVFDDDVKQKLLSQQN